MCRCVIQDYLFNVLLAFWSVGIFGYSAIIYFLNKTEYNSFLTYPSFHSIAFAKLDGKAFRGLLFFRSPTHLSTLSIHFTGVFDKNIIYRLIWSYGDLFLLMPKVGQNFSLAKKKWYQSYITFNQPKEQERWWGGLEVGHPFLLFCHIQSRHRNLKEFALIKTGRLHMVGGRGLFKCKGVESCPLEDN